MALTPEEQQELQMLEAELSGAQQDTSGVEVLQEQHPDVGFKTRALLKNFAQSPEASAEYLKNQGLDARVMNGQVVVKRPEETQFRVVDPEGLDLQDISDVAYDVGAGVASGVATGAAGLAGGAVSGGAGAIPSAMLAGGASSAGLEALRQKLGARFGIPQEVSASDVGIAGTVGAVAPGLLGTGGAVGKGLASKLVARAVGKAPSQAALQEAQRGAIQRGFEAVTKAGPKIGQMWSGVPAEATEIYMKNPKAVQALGAEGAEVELAAAVQDQLQSGFQQAKRTVGERLAQEIDSTGQQVDIKKAKDAVYDTIQKMKSSELARTPAYKKAIDDFQKQAREVFTEFVDVEDPVEETVKTVQKGLPNQVSARTAFELQDLLRDLAEFRTRREGLQAGGSTATALEKQFSKGAADAYGALNKELETATAGASKDLKNAYRSYTQLQKQLAGRFKDPQATFKTLQNIRTPSNKPTLEALRDLEAMSGGQINVLPSADELYAAKFYANPAMTELSGGTTGTARLLRAGGLGGYLGYKAAGIPGAAAGAAVGAFSASPFAMRNVLIPAAMTGAQMGRGIGQGLQPVMTPATIQSTWQSMRER